MQRRVDAAYTGMGVLVEQKTELELKLASFTVEKDGLFY